MTMTRTGRRPHRTLRYRLHQRVVATLRRANLYVLIAVEAVAAAAGLVFVAAQGLVPLAQVLLVGITSAITFLAVAIYVIVTDRQAARVTATAARSKQGRLDAWDARRRILAHG